MNLIVGLKDKVCPAPYPITGDITGRDLSRIFGAHGEKNCVEFCVRGLLETLIPSPDGCMWCVKQHLGAGMITPRCQTLTGGVLLFASVFAASSSSFLRLWTPWFGSWLIIDITDDFVFTFDLHLTF